MSNDKWFGKERIDLSKDYSIVYGRDGIRFEQNGKNYNHWGYLVEEPKTPEKFVSNKAPLKTSTKSKKWLEDERKKKDE
jgi:hypothetical protein